MRPPELLVCPECNSLARWMPNSFIMFQLALGKEFTLIYCQHCSWSVQVEAKGPGDLGDPPELPF